MALTKTEIVDKYEIIGEHKMVQCRHATIISEDGVELSRSFNRHVIAPGDDVSSEPAETQAIVAAVHTNAIVSAYNEHLAAQEAELI
jgi:hypothetical protein